MNTKVYSVGNGTDYYGSIDNSAYGDAAGSDSDDGYGSIDDGPVYRDTVYTPGDDGNPTKGNIGATAFTSGVTEARKAASRAWTSIAAAANWATGTADRQAPSQALPHIPLLLAEGSRRRRRAGIHTPAPDAAVISPHRPSAKTAAPAHPLGSSVLAAPAQRRTLLNHLIGFGTAIVFQAHAVSVAARDEAISKAHDLLRQKNEKDLQQAGSKVLASIMTLHTEMSMPHRMSGNVAGRVVDKVKGVFKPDCAPTQQAAKAATADILNFWQRIDNALGAQQATPSVFRPTDYKGDWPATLETPLGALSCDEFARLGRALGNEDTANTLASTMQPREHDDCTRLFMKTLGNAYAVEAKRRYQDQPIEDLARIGAAKRAGIPGQAQAKVNGQTNDQAAADDGNLTKDALGMILRGFHHEQILRAIDKDTSRPDETSAQYLARLLNVRQSKVPDLRVALGPDNSFKGMAGLNPDSAMLRQYNRVFDELQAIANEGPAAPGPATAVKTPHPTWPKRDVAEAIPTHRAGWVRQIGGGLAFWGKYLVASPASQASMRVDYLQARIDAKVDDLQRTLSLGTGFDRNKARIESRLRTLHDAVDDLHTELALQNSSRSADDYTRDSILRSLGGFSPGTLKQLWHALPQDEWEPVVAAPRTTRLRRFAQRVGKAFGNPFHDRLKHQAEMEKRPPLQERVSTTWATLRNLIEDEPDVRNFSLELRKLAAHLDKNMFAEKDYDAISTSIGKLISLDAERGVNRNIAAVTFKSALKRVPPGERSLLMKRLGKYSSRSGQDMIEFVKPKRLGTNPVPTEDAWFYARLLEDLYTAGLQLRAKMPFQADQAAIADEEQPSSPALATDSTPATPIVPAAASLMAVAKVPAAWTVAKVLPLAARSRA